ncbi:MULTISPECIES: hypothetical protein [Pseudothermotoga]|jgi:hypothetical protein|nr:MULTISPECIES: hypothetical protein [Pseudothermotoga]
MKKFVDSIAKHRIIRRLFAEDIGNRIVPIQFSETDPSRVYEKQKAQSF